MKSQIFKEKISNEILFAFLDSITNIIIDNNSKYYMIDKILYKKLEYNNYIQNFLDSICKYYYNSKQFYVNRAMNYNNFLTIIRQICKINNNKIKKKIVYNNSEYNIIYYIYININSI